MSRAFGRPGFAAPLALWMLAAVTALAAASFHAVLQARRSATRFRGQEQAASAADLGLQSLLGSWDAPRLDSLPIGAVDSSTDLGPAGTRAFVTRITSRLFWLEASATTGSGTSVEASRTHHLLAEVLRPFVPASAALISRGAVLVGPGAVLEATDTPPPDWPDCPSGKDSTGSSVLVPEGVAAQDHDARPIPGSAVDEAAGRLATYQVLGEVSVSQLAARADLVLAAGAVLSQPRDSGVARVVYASGDLVVTGQGGRGVLLVDGRLSIRGPFRFAGVVVAARGVDTNGPDVSVYGTMLSAGTEGVVWRASGALRRSTCAVRRASDAAAKPFVVARRGWAELH